MAAPILTFLRPIAWKSVMLLGVLATHVGFAAGYDQMVLVLDHKPYYRSNHDFDQGVLTLDVRKVGEKELAPLQLYDPDLVSRVWIEKRGDDMTRIKLFLKSPKVRSTIRVHGHPHRLTIDLFTPEAMQARDPGTGLPLLPAIAEPSKPSRPAQLARDPRTSMGSKKLVNSPRSQETYRFSAKNPPRAAASEPKSYKRRLLQPIPKLADDAGQRMAELEAIPSGRLPGWQTFPPFVYRIDTRSYKGSANYKRYLNRPLQGKLAGFAAKAGELYEFGHEQRSLAAYRYILQNDPALFNDDPLHLWRMAELNFGSLNFTLAKGYYQALLSQFPASELAGMCKLRLADLLWLPHKGAAAPQSAALEAYAPLSQERHSELASQAVIRQAYLSQNPQPGQVPSISAESNGILESHRQRIESQKTLYFSRALTLGYLLKDKPQAIAAASTQLRAFAKTYPRKPQSLVTSTLRARFRANVNDQITERFAQKDYLGVIEQAQAAPSRLAPLSAKNHHAVAESYRHLGQYPAAIRHYEDYRNSKNLLPHRRFVAGIWQLDSQVKAMELVEPGAAQRRLQRQARTLDRALIKEYIKLKPEQQKAVVTELKSTLIRLSQNRRFVATPARIVLSVWQHSLLPDAKSLENPDRLPKWQPDSRTVPRLTNLKRTFHLQGMRPRSEKVDRLLTALDPKLFQNDPISKKIWTKEILKLAETYRKDKQYLKAGRMYTLSAHNDDGWERRAEALYKGGLLLYRAGKRQEAVKAFRQASLDVNNLLYAELAKKRLDQISKP